MDENNNNGSHGGPILRKVRENNLAREFVTIGSTFSEAAGRTVLPHKNFWVSAVLLKRKLELYDLEEEINTMTDLLNGLPAIGGYSRMEALMAHTGIISPPMSRAKFSNKEKEQLEKAQATRSRRDGHEEEDNY